MSAGKRFVDALEDTRRHRRMFEQFGPPEDWVVPVEEIEDVLLRSICRHGLPEINDCQDCMTRELTRRQFRILAERMGCDRPTAVSVADGIVARQDAKGAFGR